MAKIVIEEESKKIVRSLKVNFDVKFEAAATEVMCYIYSKTVKDAFDNAELVTSGELTQNSQEEWSFSNYTKERLAGLKAKCNLAEKVANELNNI